MTTTHASEPQQLPLPMQLNEIGNGHRIPRNDGESDADYAERLIFELDVEVEELWAVQDNIRAIRDAIKHEADDRIPPGEAQ